MYHFAHSLSVVKDFLSCLPFLQPFPALAWAKLLLQMCNASSSMAYPGSCIHVAAIKGSLPLGLSFTVTSLAHCLTSVPLLPSPLQETSAKSGFLSGYSFTQMCSCASYAMDVSSVPALFPLPAFTPAPFLQEPPTRPLSHPKTSQGFPLRGFCRARGKGFKL